MIRTRLAYICWAQGSLGVAFSPHPSDQSPVTIMYPTPAPSPSGRDDRRRRIYGMLCGLLDPDFLHHARSLHPLPLDCLPLDNLAPILRSSNILDPLTNIALPCPITPRPPLEFLMTPPIYIPQMPNSNSTLK
ncbi:hypothetical protein DL93DRAFT_938679 [Clavulina sp. PMI_390]|nr:hypothetical protein DL93DRAFT_938679 [Clavulina sp. PMI_390]